MVVAVATTLMRAISDMATRNEIGGLPASAAKYLTRAVICLFGLAAIVWGALTFPLFWQQVVPKSVAAKLLQGQTFKTQWLLTEAEQAEAADRRSSCNPTALHDAVILRLAILNGSANREIADAAYQTVYAAARRALSCAPADPFVWLTLFWLDAAKHGFNPDNANYLRLSYALGPNESWIALWRNRLAFALFEQLPADLSDDAIEEFIKLVDTRRLYWETAKIFESAPVIGQNRIVEHLKTANAISRQAFAEVLHRKGLDVSIPGESQTEARPWKFTLPPSSAD